MRQPFIGVIPQTRTLILFMPCGCVQTHILDGQIDLSHDILEGDGWELPVHAVSLTSTQVASFGKGFPIHNFIFHGSEEECEQLVADIKKELVEAGMMKEVPINEDDVFAGINEGEEE